MNGRLIRVVEAAAACAAVLVIVSWAWGQDKAGPSADKLSKILQKYPEADANKDGVLTAEEARAYMQSKGPKPGKGGPGGVGGGMMGLGDPAEVIKNHPDWDTNKDGKLSDEEIRAGRAAMFNMSREEMEAKILKEHPDADTNGDGKLSPEEFAAFRAKMGGPPFGRGMPPAFALDQLIERFAEADLDGNGQLSKEELVKFRQKLGPGPGMPGGFGGFGPPKDRPIPEEARAKILQKHPEADTDKDGKLSDAEAKAFMEQQRGLGKGPDGKPGKGPGDGKGRHGKGSKGAPGAAGEQSGSQ
jgi:Ca2+-binding EF-hand superfamily protein